MSFIAKAALVALSASERPSVDVVKCLQLLGNNSHKKTHVYRQNLKVQEKLGFIATHLWCVYLFISLAIRLLLSTVSIILARF